MMFFSLGMWSALQVPHLGVILATLAPVKILRFLILDKKMEYLHQWGYNLVVNFLICHTILMCSVMRDFNLQQRWINKKILSIIMSMETMKFLDMDTRLPSIVGLLHLGLVLFLCLTTIYIPRSVCPFYIFKALMVSFFLIKGFHGFTYELSVPSCWIIAVVYVSILRSKSVYICMFAWERKRETEKICMAGFAWLVLQIASLC